MENLKRLKKVLNFESADRLPVMEWAGWWDKTVLRWREEGLPQDVKSGTDIMEYFGLDVHRQFWIPARGPKAPKAPAHGKSIMGEVSMDGYLKIKEHLYSLDVFDREELEKWAAKKARGEVFIWLTLDGFFWHPRTIMGIEEHLYSFYDEPELMHAMNRNLLEYNLRVLDEFCKVCVPDFITFAEDMSYNHGPMISRSAFDEFIAPYYSQIVPRLRDYGIEIIIDTDGDIHELIPWFDAVDVHGFLPLERQAGVDIIRLRNEHPRLKIIGGFDKTVMHKGEDAMRAEFDRLFPVMCRGGYIPSCDHQTPPDVSIENYRIYVRLLKEYCTKAMA